nr:helix-turn-helix domain-containing protein [Tannerella forsythia]
MHYNHLTREHRYAIYLGSEEGERHEAIARQINVHPSSICVKTCCKSIFFFVL